MRQVDFASNLEVTTGSVVDRCSLSLLALFLGKCALLVDTVASSKLFSNCFSSWGGGARCEPWVADDVSNAESLVRVELQHAGDEVLKVIRVEPCWLAVGVRVSLPEQVGPVGGDQLVVLVFLVGHAEGRVARVQDEEDHSKGKQIDNLALVGLSQKNFRGHVTSSAND